MLCVGPVPPPGDQGPVDKSTVGPQDGSGPGAATSGSCLPPTVRPLWSTRSLMPTVRMRAQRAPDRTRSHTAQLSSEDWPDLRPEWERIFAGSVTVWAPG